MVERGMSINYYRPQRSCEGYVFTGVCLSTGGVTVGCLVRGVPGPGGCLVGGSASAGWGGGWYPTCTEADPPGRDGYCCGRYASYWNAFLFLLLFLHLCSCFLCKFLANVVVFAFSLSVWMSCTLLTKATL